MEKSMIACSERMNSGRQYLMPDDGRMNMFHV
jgi:hypothetical protein